MASLPQQRASQRQSSPREQESTEQSQLPRTNSEAVSATSQDSHTVLINNRREESSAKPSEITPEQSTAPKPPQRRFTDNEPRKCWICFSDETEDTPMDSEWRSPCPCALVAHEACLLDWIADMEAPNSRRRAGANNKILCPQCKNEIQLARPRSLVVDAYRGVEALAGRFVLPGVLSLAAVSVGVTMFMHGQSTIYLIFGLKEGHEILGRLRRPLYMQDFQDMPKLVHRVLEECRLITVVSSIPPVLIASRTTIADTLLPFAGFAFIASSSASTIYQGSDSFWPPSAALSFAVLPYLRAAYNSYYERVWAPKARKWLKEVQPRQGGNADNGNGPQEAGPAAEAELLNAAEDENILEINLDVDIREEWNDDWVADHEHPADEQQNAEAAPAQVPPPPPGILQAHDDAMHQIMVEARDDVQDRGNDPQPQVNEPAPAAAAPAQPPQRRVENNLIFSTNRIADLVLGALVFPSIAALAGDLLKYTLPTSWVTPPRGSGRLTGLLQARWGRSLVGGCAFVVLKDAVTLYVRWRMAVMHRRRRVVDWDRSKGKKAGAAR